MAMERAEIVLLARSRFDLRATVLSQDHAELPPFRWCDGRRPSLERAEELPDGSVHLLRIRQVRRGVVLEVTGRDAREIEVLAPLATRVRRALALDQDLAHFHRACARDPLLRPGSRLGLGRVLRGTSVFEDVVKILAAGSAPRDGVRRAFAGLTTFGRRCAARPALRTFPSPVVLARAPLRRLAEHTGLGDRCAWIRTLARAVVARRCDLEGLEHLPAADAVRFLRTVDGLGPAAMARVLLVLGHHDVLLRDRAARSLVRRGLGGEHARLERWLRRQAPWRGRALWLALRLADPAAAGALRTARPPAIPARRGGHS
jgi:3-methyladenine DNA glycosylase/8-oxoguanine DNA glycosylase